MCATSSAATLLTERLQALGGRRESLVGGLAIPLRGFAAVPRDADPNSCAWPRQYIAYRSPLSAPLRYHCAASSAFFASPPRPRSYMVPRLAMACPLPASAPRRYHCTASASLLASPPRPSSYIEPRFAIAAALPPSTCLRYRLADTVSSCMHSPTRLKSDWVCIDDALQRPSGYTCSSFTLMAFVRVLHSANKSIIHSC